MSGSKSFQGLAGTADVTSKDFSSTAATDGTQDISLDGGKTKTTIRLDSATLGNDGSDLTKVSATHIVSAINSQISSSFHAEAAMTRATVGSDGRTSFSMTKVGAQQQLSVTSSASSTLDIGFGKGSCQAGAIVTGTAAMTTDGNVTLVFKQLDLHRERRLEVDGYHHRLNEPRRHGDRAGRGCNDSPIALRRQSSVNCHEAGFDVTDGNATNTTLTFTSKNVGAGSALTLHR